MEEGLLENERNGANSELGSFPTRNWIDSGLEISFRDLSYTLHKGSRHEKEILKSMSSVISRNQLTALFGPTGSGKSSLLDCLAMRKSKKSMGGDIFVNGKKMVESVFKPLVGYVVQSDILMGNLTCRENIMFSANLRLSHSTYSQQHRNRIVDEVIESFGLSVCANTLVGNELIRGLSGGEVRYSKTFAVPLNQRKRTMIACELIIRPQLLLLDEPTSGLDASTSVSIVKELAKLAREQKVTVLMSIHQPRYSIWKQLDNVMVLSRGNLIYSGLQQDVVLHFESFGFSIDAHDNPADFLLDVLSGIIPNRKESETVYRNADGGIQDSSFHAHKILLQAWEPTRAVTNTQMEDYGTDYITSSEFELRDRLSFCTQFRIISGKTVTGMKRVPHIIILQFCAMIFFAFVTGGIYYQQKLDETGLQNRLGAFFFLIMSMVFSNLNAIELFLRERVLFIHQRSNGYYDTGPYFLAMLVCDLLPMRIFPMIAYALIIYPMMGFQPNISNFCWFLITLLVECVCSGSLCYLMSAAIGVFMLANLAVSVAYVITMIFGGLLVNVKNLPLLIRWLQYFSFFKYGYEALAITELHGLTFNTTLIPGMKPIPVSGDLILSQRGFELKNRTWDIIAMVMLTLAFNFLAYIYLNRLTAAKL